MTARGWRLAVVGALALWLGAGVAGMAATDSFDRREKTQDRRAAAAARAQARAAFQALEPEPAARPSSPQASTGSVSEFDQFDSEFAKRGAAYDPWERFNRAMFLFNDKFYFWVAKPAARGYAFILPKPPRTGIALGFDNLGFPLRFLNSSFQRRFRGAGREFARFIINSTLGVGGLFDPADRWFHIAPSNADFGQTFGRYGAGRGPPLFLPILGPLNLRDGIGTLPNSVVDPTFWVMPGWRYTASTAGGKIDNLSLHIGDYEKIKKDSLDPYTFIRDAYQEYRDKKIAESKEDK